MSDADRIITVAVDGTPAAANAVRWAREHATATGATLQLVHVVEDDEVAPWPAVKRRDPDDRSEVRTPPAIEEAQRLIDQADGEITVTHTVLSGPAGPSLVDASRTSDLIVIGRRTKRTPGWLRPGSTSHRVADDAVCPVVIVPTTDGGSSP